MTFSQKPRKIRSKCVLCHTDLPKATVKTRTKRTFEWLVRVFSCFLPFGRGGVQRKGAGGKVNLPPERVLTPTLGSTDYEAWRVLLWKRFKNGKPGAPEGQIALVGWKPDGFHGVTWQTLWFSQSYEVNFVNLTELRGKSCSFRRVTRQISNFLRVSTQMCSMWKSMPSTRSSRKNAEMCEFVRDSPKKLHKSNPSSL